MEDTGAHVTAEYVYGIAAAADFATGGVCYAANGSGLLRSEDGGATWEPAIGALPVELPLPVTCVALAAGTVVAGVPGGIVASDDDGANWRTCPLADLPPFLSTIAASPQYAQDGILFVGTMEDGVFVSIDRGMRWQAWNIGLLDHTILALAVSPAYAQDHTLFAATESGIFRSTNGGRFWRETPFPMDKAPVLCLAVSTSFATDGILFAGTAADGLFVSHDRGANWSAVPAPAGAVNMLLLGEQSPPLLLALIDDALFLSQDGVAWQPCDQEFGAGVAAVAAPDGLAVGRLLLVGLDDGRLVRAEVRAGVITQNWPNALSPR